MSLLLFSALAVSTGAVPVHVFPQNNTIMSLQLVTDYTLRTGSLAVYAPPPRDSISPQLVDRCSTYRRSTAQALPRCNSTTLNTSAAAQRAQLVYRLYLYVHE